MKLVNLNRHVDEQDLNNDPYNRQLGTVVVYRLFALRI
jgi:hypothetical protein